MILPKDFNPGAFPDRPDSRDIPFTLGAVQIDWDKGYNVLDEIKNRFGIDVKVEHQNGSQSCVGQAWSKYAEVLNIVETGLFSDLSAKSIYEQIYMPGGGSSIRDGAKIVVDKGIAEESVISSYINGNPPTEAYMRSQSITEPIRKQMVKYSAKEYQMIGSMNPDLMASAILNNWGAISGAYGDNAGWSSYVVKKPGANPWGHCYYYIGFGQDSKGKYFDFLNSWGTSWGLNGKGRMYYEEYDMPNNTFGAWTLTDKSNHMFVKTANDPSIYMINGNKRTMMVDMPSLEIINNYNVRNITEAEMAQYVDAGTYVWVERIIK